MAEYAHFIAQLAEDAELWQGLSFDLGERERVASQLIAGAIAIRYDQASATDLAGSEFFSVSAIHGETYLVPRRYRQMLHYFLQAKPAVANIQANTISPLLNTLITGGPGTGKSYQISRFVESLAQNSTGAPVRVVIAAPTGKAAARFSGLETVPNMLLECLTIHRLLQLSTDGGSAKYHATNPLPVDVLIIDEISMVDLGLFVRLISAMPTHAQLVLAGDTGQLPAVDGIAIKPALDLLVSAGLLHHVKLTQSHRFSAKKAEVYAALQQQGIAAVTADSEGVSIVDIKDTRSLMAYADAYARERFLSPQLTSLAETLVITRVGDPAFTEAAREVLRYLQQSIILCEGNSGSHGTAALNARLTAEIRRATSDRKCQVTPIMVTENSYDLQLFNGDTGFILSDGQHEQAIIDSGARIKCLPLGRLRYWQLAYAITIHKSQGSEYGDVHIVHAPLKTTQGDHRLLYTAVTRARQHAFILKLSGS